LKDWQLERLSHGIVREPHSEKVFRYSAREVRRHPPLAEVNAMEDLLALRTLAGVSQFTCARKARVPRVRISLFESGQLELTSEERTRIRAVLLRVIEARALQLQMVLADCRAEGAGASV
jgi:hypothetical protein